MLTWIGLDHVVCFEEILNFPLITKIVYKSIVEIKFGFLNPSSPFQKSWFFVYVNSNFSTQFLMILLRIVYTLENTN